jgi:hypothetical protein
VLRLGTDFRDTDFHRRVGRREPGNKVDHSAVKEDEDSAATG